MEEETNPFIVFYLRQEELENPCIIKIYVNNELYS